jgi:ribosomal protein L7Ae-like RNA K-turn-binding protein
LIKERDKKKKSSGQKLMIQNITPDQKLTSLIGFALKSGKFVTGFEAIRNELIRHRLSLILINKEISENTQKKVFHLSRKNNVPVFKTTSGTIWKESWGIENKKILGVLKGEIGSSILKILKQEH